MMILEIWNIKLDEGALCSVYAMSVWTNSQTSDSANARDRLKIRQMLENFFGKENFSLPTDPKFLGPCYLKRNIYSTTP